MFTLRLRRYAVLYVCSRCVLRCARRAADADGDALNEVRELERLEHASRLTFFQWVKLMLFKLVRRVGFLGILVCASVRLSLSIDHQSVISNQ